MLTTTTTGASCVPIPVICFRGVAVGGFLPGFGDDARAYRTVQLSSDTDVDIDGSRLGHDVEYRWPFTIIDVRSAAHLFMWLVWGSPQKAFIFKSFRKLYKSVEMLHRITSRINIVALY